MELIILLDADIMPILNRISADIAELKVAVRAIQTQELRVMSVQDDLTAAVADITTKINENHAAIQTEIAQLRDALASGDTTAVQAAVDNIAALSSQVAGDTAELQADDVAPLPPAV